MIAMEYCGYSGRILRVDLASGESETIPLNLDDAKDFLGGSGLSYKLASGLIAPDTQPEDPENPLIISAGPLVGTPVPGASHIQGTTIFPLPATENGKFYLASGDAGSRRFGIEFKSAGYDHLIITGKAAKPTFLKIDDDDVELCDANALWGKRNTYETTDELLKLYPGSGVIAIGRAGEKLVRFAMAIVDGNNTLGRNGFGAVMGSKNLKAIVVRGSKGVKISDPKKFLGLVKETIERCGQSEYVRPTRDLGLHGTWQYWRTLLNPGYWPKESWDELYGPERCKELIVGAVPCSSCVLDCKHILQIPKGEFAGVQMRITHFLTAAVLAQWLNLQEPGEVFRFVELCNESGMCAVACAAAVYFLSTMYAIGYIDSDLFNGFEPSQDYPSLLKLAELVIEREAIGDIVAEGWFKLAERVEGIDYSSFVGMVKGSICIYDARDTKLDPRVFHMVVNPRGAHHPICHWTTSIPRRPLEWIREDLGKMGLGAKELDRILSPELNVGRLTRHVQDAGTVYDSLGVCVIYALLRMGLDLDVLSQIYSAATGIEMSAVEMKKSGERSFNLLKAINAERGFDRGDDTFPELWFDSKYTKDGDEALMDYYRQRPVTREYLNSMLDDYYDERGWDIEKGVPNKKKLTELGL